MWYLLYGIAADREPALVTRRDRIVVSTLRCGRSNPGSNPGHGIANTMSRHKGRVLTLWGSHSYVVVTFDSQSSEKHEGI